MFMSDRRKFIKQISLLGIAMMSPVSINSLMASSVQTNHNEPIDFEAIIKLATLAPSPHNIQPWLFEKISNNTLSVKYDSSKMIPVLDKGNKFMTLSMCLLVEYFDIVARNFGYGIKKEFVQEIMSEGETVKAFCTLTFYKNTNIKTKFSNELIKNRQTSREAYSKTSLPQNLVNELNNLLKNKQSVLNHTNNEDDINWIANLNKEAIFNDMDSESFREEMTPWMRFSSDEAESKRDGLWSKCMNFPSGLMRNFFINHEKYVDNTKRKVLEKTYYNKSKKTPSIMWVESSFETFDDLKNCGELLAHIGLVATKYNCFIQPFGSIITNPEKKSVFVKKHYNKEQEDNLWFIFRIGESKTPTRSHRHEIKNILK